MSGLVLILILILIVDFILISTVKPIKSLKQEVAIAAKMCPPHKWRYQELKDSSGETVRWKIVCDVCGPMRREDEQQQ